VCAFTTIDYDITNHDFLGEKGAIFASSPPKVKTNKSVLSNEFYQQFHHRKIFMTASHFTRKLVMGDPKMSPFFD